MRGGQHSVNMAAARECAQAMSFHVQEALRYQAGTTAGDAIAAQSLVDQLHQLKDVMETRLPKIDGSVRGTVLNQVLLGSSAPATPGSHLERMCALLPVAAAADAAAGVTLLSLVCSGRGGVALCNLSPACLSTLCTTTAELMRCCLEGKCAGTGAISRQVNRPRSALQDAFGGKGLHQTLSAASSLADAVHNVVAASVQLNSAMNSPVNNAAGSGQALAVPEAAQHALAVLDAVGSSGLVQVLCAILAQPRPSTGCAEDEQSWEYEANAAASSLHTLLHCAGTLKHVSLGGATAAYASAGATNGALGRAPDTAASQSAHGVAASATSGQGQQPLVQTHFPSMAEELEGPATPTGDRAAAASAFVPAASHALTRQRTSGSDADDETSSMTSMHSANSEHDRGGMAVSTSDFADAVDSAADHEDFAARVPLLEEEQTLSECNAAMMEPTDIEQGPEDLQISITAAPITATITAANPVAAPRRGSGQLRAHALSGLSPQSTPSRSRGTTGQQPAPSPDAAAIATQPLVMSSPTYARAIGTLLIDSPASDAGQRLVNAAAAYSAAPCSLLLSPGSAANASVGGLWAPAGFYGPSSPVHQNATEALLRMKVASQLLPFMVSSKHAGACVLNLYGLLLRVSATAAQDMQAAPHTERMAELLDTLLTHAPACVTALLLATFPSACQDLEVRCHRLHTAPMSPSATDVPTGAAARSILGLEEDLKDMRAQLVAQGNDAALLDAAIAAAQCRKAAAGPSRCCLACGVDASESAGARPMRSCPLCDGELWCSDTCRYVDGTRHAMVCTSMLQQV